MFGANIGSAHAAVGMLPIDPNTGMINTNAMRRFIDSQGASCVLNASGEKVHTNAPALLRYDEWKDIDRRVIAVATQRLVGIADLIGRGLTHSLGSIGVTVAQWERSSDMTEAEADMSGISKGEEDTPAFELQYVPVPIIHKDFRVNIRRLEASRRMGEAIDTVASDIASRRVAEKSEDMLFAGLPIQVDGGTIYGYTTHPHRNTVDLTLAWDDPSITGQEIVADVEAMLASARADNYYGPFELYIPGTYEGVLDRDYAYASGDNRTIRQRIMQLSGIAGITVADRLADDNVLLIQMTSDVVDLAIARDVNTVQWQVDGGMQERFKVMAVWVPRIKSDFDGKSGIVHLRSVG